MNEEFEHSELDPLPPTLGPLNMLSIKEIHEAMKNKKSVGPNRKFRPVEKIRAHGR